ncbi:MAG: hypothetical protein B6244_00365 [Candidatus Cloacimonetes bacterium 4572_55]|nr:MAG: hypothetical protein B6244_00365 [Candidatus Cloacimonetes bacterium 4572_55]
MIDSMSIMSMSMGELITNSFLLITEITGKKPAEIYRLDWTNSKIKSIPFRLNFFLIQGRIRFLLDQIDEADDLFEFALQSVSADFERAVCLYAKVLVLQQRGFHSKALPIIQEVVKVAGNYRILRASAYNILGKCYAGSKNEKQAEIFYRKALCVNIDILKPAILRNLSGCLYHQNRIEEAEICIKQSLESAGREIEEYRLICTNDFGGSALNAGRYEEALVYYKKVISLASSLRNMKYLVMGYTNVGAIYQKLNRLDKSLENLRQAIKLSPFVRSRALLSERLKGYGDIARLSALQMQKEGYDPRAVNERFILANTAIEQGLEAAEEAQNLRQKTGIWFNRSLLELKCENFPAALEASRISMETLQQFYTSGADPNPTLQNNILECLMYISKKIAEQVKAGERIEWRQTPIRGKFDLSPQSYQKRLYGELIIALEKVASVEKRVRVKPLAQMLSIFQGRWFKNSHYSYLGPAWTTATKHLKLLVHLNVLEKRGKISRAEYRLHPKFCPIVTNKIV